MIEAKFSTHFEAIKSRMKRLPVLLKDEVETQSLKNAQRLIELFKEGIKKRNFGLIELKPKTIDYKRKQKYSAPENPLYGTNRKKNRYNNMMIIVKESKRWIVKPRSENHWKGKLSLLTMFHVHEYGATISGKSVNGKPFRIRIPPRPAFRMAYNQLMRELAKNETSDKVRDKIKEFMTKGNWRAQKRQQARNE